MKKALILEVEREGYGIDQVQYTMTVGDLIRLLEDYNEDTPIYVSHDNGYTFGGVKENNFDDSRIYSNEDYTE